MPVMASRRVYTANLVAPTLHGSFRPAQDAQPKRGPPIAAMHAARSGVRLHSPAVTPFRTRGDDAGPPLAPSDVVRDAVSQMVRQFADPLALYRELVQNSLDAGATRIDVRLSFEPGEGERGTLRVVVRDDGCGMSLDTIERCLLVLFRSSKDGDNTRIGKFGVGFFSVFAIEPEVVLVDTGTGPDGYRLALRPDYTYEIETASPRRGTTITLRVPASVGEARTLADRSVEALARWCPHVSVPLHFASTGVPGSEIDRRIDSPFGIDGMVTAVQRMDDGTAFAVALSDAPTASFYNRGILLYQTAEVFVPGASLKLESRALEHTLSRDNVRRDAAFDCLVERARAFAGEALRARALAALGDAAERCARARHDGRTDPEAAEQLRCLSSAVLSPLFTLHAREIAWPLVHPLRDAAGRVLHVWRDAPPAVFATAPDPLTAILAARGVPVIDVGAGTDGHEPFTQLYARFVDGPPVSVHERWCAPRVTPDEDLEPTERTLLAALRPMLAAVGLTRVALADPLGAGANRLFLALDADALDAPDPHLLVDAADADRQLFSLFGARGLALTRSHARVRAAVAAAESDPALAAMVLARFVLLAAGKLDAKRDRALIEHAIVGGSAA
jgi:molecular chaperone HtpG